MKKRTKKTTDVYLLINSIICILVFFFLVLHFVSGCAALEPRTEIVGGQAIAIDPIMDTVSGVGKVLGLLAGMHPGFGLVGGVLLGAAGLVKMYRPVVKELKEDLKFETKVVKEIVDGVEMAKANGDKAFMGPVMEALKAKTSKETKIRIKELTI